MNSYSNFSTFIVDDDPYWAALLKQLLRDMEIENISIFDNGTDCINRIHLLPETVFLDFQMEDLNGLEVLQKIKKRSPDTNVVFCTAYQDLGIAMEAIKYGSFDYLLKENISRKEMAGLISRLKANR